MKSNAPEKIFLEWYRIGDKKYRDWCIIPKTNDESVEYIRTDAFIKKACEWLKENFLFDEAGYCKTNIYSTESMIYNFKNTLERR